MDDEVVFILIALIGAILWLAWKLRAARQKELRLVLEKEELTRANAAMEAENAILETEQLKFQLQPHTLKNILANLKLIATKLSRGMDSLSSTLEYILYKGRTHLVSVEEELGFIQTYLKLNDLFLNEVDAIVIDTQEVDQTAPAFRQPCIPHLISAYFIENAFKHGDKDHPEFLRIRIKLNNDIFQFEVSNRIRQIDDEHPGGLGLANMKKRLELLMAGQYELATSRTTEEYHARLSIRCNA